MDSVLDRIIIREGGWKITNRKNDRGGLTFGGMTLRTLNDWLEGQKRPQLEGYTDCEATRDVILECYRAEFIKPLSWLHTRTVCRGLYFEIVADAAVHHGMGNAVRMLQRAHRIPDDGIVGPQTRKHASAATLQHLTAFTRERVLFMARDVKRNPKQLENIVGWQHRAMNLLHKAMITVDEGLPAGAKQTLDAPTVSGKPKSRSRNKLVDKLTLSDGSTVKA